MDALTALTAMDADTLEQLPDGVRVDASTMNAHPVTPPTDGCMAV